MMKSPFVAVFRAGTIPSQLFRLVSRLVNRSGGPVGLALVAVMTFASSSATGHDGPTAATTDQSDKPHQHTAQGILLPAIEGPKPWSDAPALTGEDRFQFAVVTDRTGGHRPGIWMKAVHRLNWMRPEFVVSVGDLIEGYTTNRTQIDGQWAEFLAFIDQLEMKFFFVPGNHDVSNPTMQKVWREYFGKAWYSFDYKNVHFVCLLSEDPEAHIGESQLAWLKDDLAANADARWTMIFLHKPLWTHTEAAEAVGNPDPSNWSRVRELLGDRPHTVFAGHTHHYMMYQRGEYQYYNLATTGGGSALRGPRYGEFDHITWVTMEADGPKVANLQLDGILPGDIVTETVGKQFAQFLKTTHFAVEPVLVGDDKIRSAKILLKASNEHATSVKFTVRIYGLPNSGVTFADDELEWTLKPGQAEQYEAEFRLSEPIDVSRFKNLFVTTTMTSTDEIPLQAEVKSPVLIGKARDLPMETHTVDGNLSDWKTADWNYSEPLDAKGPASQWTDSKDGSFELFTTYDDKNVFIGLRVFDDQLIDGDKVTIVVDARDVAERMTNSQLTTGTSVMTVSAPDQTGQFELDLTGGAVATAQAARRIPGGYEVEWSMPMSPVYQLQGRNWSGFQIGARQTDLDAGDETPILINWHAGPTFTENNNGLVHIFRSGE